ncbi:MAG: hypothetical protein J6S57_01400 [Alphaproteobacteria bacterium]|nr:hypothetical protein [Alphaproteobacteria bacterium]
MRSINEMYFSHRIKNNQRAFLRMERAVARERDLAKRCVLAKQAADFAVMHTTDIFSSPIVEEPFITLAQKIKIPLSKKYTPKTTLHVMTESYTSGGHTRCVERWAQQMTKYKHSCVILRQHADIPKQLGQIMRDSGGELIVFNPNETIVHSAMRVRELASKYELIVLHIHMNDPISLVAFGTTEFTRPVIFFNHADHAFWVGVSISDWVADLNYNRNQLTLKSRGTNRASVLGIPADNTKLLKISKTDARKKLGLPLDKKIIFSSGQPTKYDPLGHPDFSDLIQDVIKQDKNILFYIAGANKNAIFWPKMLRKYPNNLFLTGRLDYATEYPMYLAASDLVIDSFPVGGETAVIDAVKAGKPVLTSNHLFQEDFLTESIGSCHDYTELLEKTHKISNDRAFAKKVYQDIYSRFIDATDTKKWTDRCNKIISKLPKQHKVYKVKSCAPTKDITVYSWSTTRWTEPIDKVFSLSRFRKWLISVHLSRHSCLIRICGIYLLNKRRKNEYNTKNFTI